MCDLHYDYAEVLEFEGRLLEKYGLDDVLRLSKRDFMEWVETPEKGRNASVLL